VKLPGAILQKNCLIVKIATFANQHFLSPDRHSKNCQQNERIVFTKNWLRSSWIFKVEKGDWGRIGV